ncbi:sensor histidine kinase [Achromobacter xylosoxidans]|uniref:sensor histidine kinase n=1 Tax=Pseudomonadota TaxID=1224 RepID=UPI001F114810|nr:ATP-binding protein [Achromobacter xylosoxidans]MCH4578067.1 ATP-binding protein [Achromobacter xylosoxidans]
MKIVRLLRPKRRPASLRWWFGLRTSALAVGTVVVIAFTMLLYFNIADSLTLRQVPAEVRQEIEELRADPEHNESRLWELLKDHYNIKRLMPGLANPDWLMLACLVILAVPVIILFGLWTSRPLSRQFMDIAQAALRVSEGNFATRVGVVRGAPDELAELAHNFNDMTIQLQQYEREVRDSSAMLAHELRTPLNAAMGRIQGMLDEVFPLEQDQLRSVHRQLEQINRLIGDLHLVSLARAGQLALEVDSFALRDLIAERLEWAAPVLQEAGISPAWPSTTGIRLYADRDRIGQLLSVLIDNAVRYAARGKVLEIDTHATPSLVTIRVADRGPGVAEEQLPSMLDRFWRAETSRARHFGGSGLGLAIAAAICQAHGGDLECSNRRGGGLLVTVRLPNRTDTASI